MRIVWPYIAVVLLFVATGYAQQQMSPDSTLISQPAYNAGSGPVVAIDEAHKNTHTYGSRPFQGLVRLLQTDGYRVRPFAAAATRSSLKGIDVLIVSGPGGWGTPADSLTDPEVRSLVEWVDAGGSLLFILGHMPDPLNGAQLATALGLTGWHNGYAMVEMADSRQIGNIIFWRTDSFPGGDPAIAPTGPAGGTGYQGADAKLAKHSITEGRNPAERVRKVATFVGSAFRAPSDWENILMLPRRAISLVPPLTPNAIPPITRDTPRVPVAGWLQGAVRKMGKGRVAVFGDTALFSGGPAADNRQFVLNVMHWLTRVL